MFIFLKIRLTNQFTTFDAPSALLASQ